MATETSAALDEAKVEGFVNQAVGELGATYDAGEWYVREWLNAQAGEARLREVVAAGGFTRFGRAAETPFNLVLEARP